MKGSVGKWRCKAFFSLGVNETFSSHHPIMNVMPEKKRKLKAGLERVAIGCELFERLKRKEWQIDLIRVKGVGEKSA